MLLDLRILGKAATPKLGLSAAPERPIPPEGFNYLSVGGLWYQNQVEVWFCRNKRPQTLDIWDARDAVCMTSAEAVSVVAVLILACLGKGSEMNFRQPRRLCNQAKGPANWVAVKARKLR